MNGVGRVKIANCTVCSSILKLFKHFKLCHHEKLEIIDYPNKRKLLMNRQSELISKCYHVNKYLLSNYESDIKSFNNIPTECY